MKKSSVIALICFLIACILFLLAYITYRPTEQVQKLTTTYNTPAEHVANSDAKQLPENLSKQLISAEKFKKLKINVVNSDLILKKSTDANIVATVKQDASHKTNAADKIFQVKTEGDQMMLVSDAKFNGPITVAIPANIQAIEANTVSGDLRVQEVSSPNVALSVTSTSGDIAITSMTSSHSQFRANTTSGDVHFSDINALNAQVILSTNSGDLQAPGISQAEKQWTHTFGAGQNKIELHSVSGDVSLQENKK